MQRNIKELEYPIAVFFSDENCDVIMDPVVLTEVDARFPEPTAYIDLIVVDSNGTEWQLKNCSVEQRRSKFSIFVMALLNCPINLVLVVEKIGLVSTDELKARIKDKMRVDSTMLRETANSKQFLEAVHEYVGTEHF